MLKILLHPGRWLRAVLPEFFKFFERVEDGIQVFRLELILTISTMSGSLLSNDTHSIHLQY